MQLFPLPELKSITNNDAFITSDFVRIYVDKEQHDHARHKCRLRFSVAHEIGHSVLHKDFYTGLNITSLNDMIRFLDEFPNDQWGWLEWHANEFAGRVLVDPVSLRNIFTETCLRLKLHTIITPDTCQFFTTQLAQMLASGFDVSPSVIEVRMKNDGLMDDLLNGKIH
jgi:Zn-dependent peptidase ImmA (M78 family)